MAIMPIHVYGKNKLKYPSPEPRKFWGWILVYSIENSTSTKFVQMMIIGWSLIFLLQGQIRVPLHLYGENVEKLFFF